MNLEHSDRVIQEVVNLAGWLWPEGLEVLGPFSMDTTVSGQDGHLGCWVKKHSGWNLCKFHSSSIERPISEYPPRATTYGVLQT